MSQTDVLIVEQQQSSERLPELLQELTKSCQLDSYQCRQRLLGRGLSLLSKGPRIKLEQISSLLRRYGYRHWLFTPSPAAKAPPRLLGLEQTPGQIILRSQKKQLVIPKGAEVLAVFAELSGRLAEQSVKQLLSSHAYRGQHDVRHLSEAKILRTILQNRPILDIYLLDKNKRILDGVRAFPGKFDHRGLGERATSSSKQNLHQLLKLAEEYAGDFHLASDFGLVNLPGCTPQSGSFDDPEVQRKNLLSLTRYGQLQADLLQAEAIQPGAAPEANELLAGIAVAAALQNPGLAANGDLARELPNTAEISAEIGRKEEQPSGAELNFEPATPGLPAPPPAKSGGLWKKPGFWLGSAGTLLGFGIMLLFESDSQAMRSLIRLAFKTGALPFGLAGLLFWGGFYFVRLKRQVENTPTSKVRSLALGMVEVKGKALRQYALLSPMSHTPCVYYRLTRYRRNKNQWQVSSISSSDNVPFLLADETGQVEIDPARCRVRAGTRQEGVPGQIGFLRVDDDADEKWLEEIIVAGTLLYVLGFAAVKAEAGPSLQEQKIAALRELKQNRSELQQFDRNGDGRIDQDEWEQARAAVEEKVLQQTLQTKQKRKRQEEHIVIGKKKGRPFIIAETHSETQLTSRYAAYTIPLFSGALAATGWGIYLFLTWNDAIT